MDRDRVSMLCPFQAPGMETVGRAKAVECLPTPLRLSAYGNGCRAVEGNWGRRKLGALGPGSGREKGWTLRALESVTLLLFLSVSVPASCALGLGLPCSGPVAADQEVRMNPLTSLSRYQPLPQITPRCGCMNPLPGRLPLQGYESPCSGRHYCLRGMDYIITGAPCGESTLRLPRVQQPTVRSGDPAQSPKSHLGTPPLEPHTPLRRPWTHPSIQSQICPLLNH